MVRMRPVNMLARQYKTWNQRYCPSWTENTCKQNELTTSQWTRRHPRRDRSGKTSSTATGSCCPEPDLNTEGNIRKNITQNELQTKDIPYYTRTMCNSVWLLQRKAAESRMLLPTELLLILTHEVCKGRGCVFNKGQQTDEQTDWWMCKLTTHKDYKNVSFI